MRKKVALIMVLLSSALLASCNEPSSTNANVKIKNTNNSFSEYGSNIELKQSVICVRGFQRIILSHSLLKRGYGFSFDDYNSEGKLIPCHSDSNGINYLNINKE